MGDGRWDEMRRRQQLSSTLSERLGGSALRTAVHCTVTAGQHEWGGWEGAAMSPSPSLARQPGRRCAKCGSDGSDGQLAAARYRILGMGDGVVRPNLVIYSPGCGWPRGAVRMESLLPALRSSMDAAQTCIITPDAIENAGDEAFSCPVCGREAGVMSGAAVCVPVPVPGDHFSRMDGWMGGCISSVIFTV